ncbi:MAG: hypothetical protein ACREPH_10620 [Rhodanobacteraceae bacterium]
MLVAFAFASGPSTAHANDAAGTATIPMRVELNRPYIEVMLTGPTERSVRAHAWVDTGGGTIILSAGLASRMGLKAEGKPVKDGGDLLAPTTVPTLDVGGKVLKLVDAHAFISTGEPHLLNHTDAGMALPGRYLRHYIVVFDYPAHVFTLADPGTYSPEGTAVKTSIGGGMPVVHASVAGKSYAFLLDTGGQYCMISDAELGPWSKQHPAWPRVAGAYGPANMLLGRTFEKNLGMLRIPTIQWGPFRIEDAGAVSRPIGAYENMMSETVGTPVIGSIGGNLLRHYKVTVDYPAQTVYLAGPTVVHAATPDMVGIMLEPATHGGYEIAGIATGVRNIKVGDRLLEVDGQDVTQAPFSRIVELLSGSPGARRTLLLQRGKTHTTVHATVQPVFK